MSKRPWVSSNERINPEDNLAEPFEKAITSEEDFRIGLELEQFLVSPENHQVVGYEGEAGIEAALNLFQSKFGWKGVLENGRVIALNKDSFTITLEPGGAIEFVCPPLEDITEIDQAISRFEGELLEVLATLSIDSLPIGYLPFDTLETVQLVPKSRYDFMYNYMPSVGSRGREMMKLTSSIQVAIDYSSEKDACRKMRLAALASPFFLALSANSLVKEGQAAEFASQRTDIWSNTDNARSGVPAFQIKENSTFQDYVNWALAAPIYFIVRDGNNIPAKNLTFSDYLNKGMSFPEGTTNPWPTKADWEQHLSTLFPWIRLRHYVEVRSFDMGPPEAQRAAAALIRGLFYSERALNNMEKIISFNDPQIVEKLFEKVSHSGLDAEVDGVSVRKVSEHLVSIADNALWKHGKGEEKFLEYYEKRIDSWNLESERNLVNKNARDYVARHSLKHLLT